MTNEQRMAMCTSWPKCLMQEYKRLLNKKPYVKVDLISVKESMTRDHCGPCTTYKPVSAVAMKPVSEAARLAHVEDKQKEGCASGRCEG